MKTIKRFLKPYKKSFFLFGPRGSGKSTWLKQVYPTAYFIDLLQMDIYQRYLATPSHMQKLVEGNTSKKTFIIDEIQRVPQLLSEVHYLIEKHKDTQFILTGSSARKLKREGIDMLAGRAVVYNFHPFLAMELGSSFSLPEALQHGMLPVVWDSIDPARTLSSYAGVYLREEVMQEGLVRNLEVFSRFLESISFSQGSQVNLTNIARELGKDRSSIENYVSILEDLLLCVRLPVFSKKAKRHLTLHRKFYYFDAGVYRELRPKGPLDTPNDIDGIALETLVLQQLRAWISYKNIKIDIYFWRTKGGSEVDFILYGENFFVAIEVKNSQHFSSKDFNGLKAFSKDYPEAQLIMLYRGNEQYKENNIMVLPVEKFLCDMSIL